MTPDEAAAYLTPEQSVRSVVHALTMLLVQKGVLASEDIEKMICDWADQQKKADDAYLAENPIIARILERK